MKMFVYGTLKKDERNHRYVENSEFLGVGVLKGYKIFSLGSYPGIQLGKSDDVVLGEVYEVNEATLHNVDRLEAEGQLYRRSIVTVNMESVDCVEVSTYIYLRNVEGRRELAIEWRGQECLM